MLSGLPRSLFISLFSFNDSLHPTHFIHLYLSLSLSRYLSPLFLSCSLSHSLFLSDTHSLLTHSLDSTDSSLSLSFLLSLSLFFIVERYPELPQICQNNRGHFVKLSHRTHNIYNHCDRTEQLRRQNCPCRRGAPPRPRTPPTSITHV